MQVLNVLLVKGKWRL